MHTNTHTYTHIHAHTHTHTSIHTHTRIVIRAHTFTHTHTGKQGAYHTNPIQPLDTKSLKHLDNKQKTGLNQKKIIYKQAEVR